MTTDFELACVTLMGDYLPEMDRRLGRMLLIQNKKAVRKRSELVNRDSIARLTDSLRVSN